MMQWLLRHRPSPAMIVALIALALAIGGVGYATIPDSGGVIHACYVEHYSHTRPLFRLIDTERGDRCRDSEKELTWNQQGPPGPPGPPGNSVAFDEQTAAISTSSDSFVDLGGPSVTVTVPPSGLIAVFARGEMVSDSGIAEIALSEPTDFSSPVHILGSCCSDVREWTTPNNSFGTSDRFGAGWLVLEATPGTRTYKLEYRNSQAGPTAHFSNRKLWVAPIG